MPPTPETQRGERQGPAQDGLRGSPSESFAARDRGAGREAGDRDPARALRPPLNARLRRRQVTGRSAQWFRAGCLAQLGPPREPQHASAPVLAAVPPRPLRLDGAWARREDGRERSRGRGGDMGAPRRWFRERLIAAKAIATLIVGFDVDQSATFAAASNRSHDHRLVEHGAYLIIQCYANPTDPYPRWFAARHHIKPIILEIHSPKDPSDRFLLPPDAVTASR